MKGDRFEEVDLGHDEGDHSHDNWYQSPNQLQEFDFHGQESDDELAEYLSPPGSIETNTRSRRGSRHSPLQFHKTEPFRPSVDNIILPQSALEMQGARKDYPYESKIADASLMGMLTTLSGVVLLVLAVASFAISFVSNLGSVASSSGFGTVLSVILLICDAGLHFGVIAAGVVGVVSGWRAKNRETLHLRHRLAAVYLILLAISLIVYNGIVVFRWIPQLYNFAVNSISSSAFVMSIVIALTTCCLAHMFLAMFMVVASIYFNSTKRQIQEAAAGEGVELQGSSIP